MPSNCARDIRKRIGASQLPFVCNCDICAIVQQHFLHTMPSWINHHAGRIHCLPLDAGMQSWRLRE